MIGHSVTVEKDRRPATLHRDLALGAREIGLSLSQRARLTELERERDDGAAALAQLRSRLAFAGGY